MSKINLNKFCGTKHWNQTLSWSTDQDPDLTYCFEETCLLWTICLSLCLFSSFQLINIYKNNRNNQKSIISNILFEPIQWNLFLIINLIICVSMILINIIEIWNIWNNSFIIITSSSIISIHWFSPLTKIMMFTYSIYLLLIFRRNAIYSSGSIFIFALLFSIYHIINFRTILLAILTDNNIYYIEINNVHLICRTLSTFLAIYFFFLNCFSYPKFNYNRMINIEQNIDIIKNQNNNNDINNENYEKEKLLSSSPTPSPTLNNHQNQYKPMNINPWFYAGFLSRITFHWFNQIIWIGYRRPLIERDLFDLDHDNRTNVILRKFHKILDHYKWRNINKQLLLENNNNNNCNGNNNNTNGYEQPIYDNKYKTKINIGWIILRSYWPLLLICGTLKFLASALTFINPIILDYLISFISSNKEPYWHGFFYASLMLISPALESIMSNQYDYWIEVVVLRARISIISIIYNKSLKMSNYSRSQYSSGEVTNIMAVDSERITEFLNVANALWATPFQIVIAFYLLWQQVQIASMAGLSFMILLIPINGYMMKKIRSFQIQVMLQKDKRSKLMNEILSGMKVLKLYAWENSFEKKISNLRNWECKRLYSVTLYNGFIVFGFIAAPFMVGLFTFATYVLLGNVLDPNKAFVSLSLFSIIRVPLGLLPMILTNGVQSLVSLSRVNKFLNSEERDEDAVKKSPDDECSIRINNATFTWSPEIPATLKNINLNVARGKLIAIVGTVGSGKSSLLSAILGDMDKLKGSVNVDGTTAYVPQQAWIRNQTVRKNITFSSSYNEEKYKKILKACCLEADLKILAAGDRTEIGERGINLSGGQKQRISLARAVYSDADIYILDDPLSAVDAHVGDKLFKNVIGNQGMLRHKTRILATHRAMILNEVDEIIVMKNGEISERGTMSELMDSQGAFAEFINEYMEEMLGEKDIDGSLMNENEYEMAKSFAEKFRPILERSRSRTNSIMISRSNSLDPPTSVKKTKQKKELTFSLKSMEKNQNSFKLSHENKQQQNEQKYTDKQSNDGKLIQEETAKTGSVKFAIYGRYFKKIGIAVTIFILITAIIGNVFQMATYLWLSDWSNDALDLLRNIEVPSANYRLIIYALLGAGEIIFSILSTLTLNLACIRASKLLHHDMLQRVMYAPMSFFDTTPTGRILNRFTKDVDVADTSLTFNIRLTLMQFLRTIVSFIMISMEAPIILVALIPILFLYYIVQRLYISSSRQLKRIESITRSPIYNHFTETVNGISSIRAYNVEKQLIDECNYRLDKNSSSFYCSQVAARWLSVRLEFFGYIIVFLAALFAVLSRDVLSPGLAGLAISYSLNITGVIGMFVKNMTDVETNIISVERLIEYAEIEQEHNYYQDFDKPKHWPKKGEIKFESYSTRYRTGLDLVLRDINFVINPREKVGVVGRTGAGKSSLTLALFRIIQPASGRIVIDEIDISRIGLFDLRSRITIIPQDPVLFTGNLRMNLDPFAYYDDQQIWQALELAHLKKFVETLDGGLSHMISEGGENMSVGQRQLVCLARALLRKSKILILDEATAAVDMETDELIQKTIRKEFSDCTILTIAHRLNTVIDYDRVLVLDHGQIAEYDKPEILLQRTDSMFYSMAKIAKLI